MCIALSIAFGFQYLVNRAPARKLLRQSSADVIASIRALQILHGSFVSARKRLSLALCTLDHGTDQRILFQSRLFRRQ